MRNAAAVWAERPAGDPPTLSIFIPARNEAGGIAATVRTLHAAARSLPGVAGLEIVVVDDGSTDATAAVVDAVARDLPEVRCVAHSQPLGYGAAWRSGWAACRGDVVFYTDADLPFDPEALARAWAGLRTHDVVVGYRVGHGGVARRLRRSAAYNLLARRLAGVRVSGHDRLGVGRGGGRRPLGVRDVPRGARLPPRDRLRPAPPGRHRPPRHVSRAAGARARHPLRPRPRRRRRRVLVHGRRPGARPPAGPRLGGAPAPARSRGGGPPARRRRRRRRRRPRAGRGAVPRLPPGDRDRPVDPRRSRARGRRRGLGDRTGRKAPRPRGPPGRRSRRAPLPRLGPPGLGAGRPPGAPPPVARGARRRRRRLPPHDGDDARDPLARRLAAPPGPDAVRGPLGVAPPDPGPPRPAAPRRARSPRPGPLGRRRDGRARPARRRRPRPGGRPSRRGLRRGARRDDRSPRPPSARRRPGVRLGRGARRRLGRSRRADGPAGDARR